jgi:prophage antirepressor-like protein
MSTDLITFHFKDVSLNAVEIDGTPWFVLADVCRVLEISKHRDAASRLDDDERGSVVVDTLGGPQETITVSESGLYSLVLTSRKPQAKPFRKWVTTEVIPSIRKTGQYSAERVSPEQQELRMKDHFKLQRKYIAVLDELEHYRRSAETWDKATALVKAGVDNDTIGSILKVPLPYLEWVRCRAEAEQ